MRKLFLSICFMGIIAAAQTAWGDAVELNSAEELQQRQLTMPPPAVTDPRLPDLNNQSGVSEFIKNRLLNDNVIIDTNFNDDDLSNSSSLDIQHSEEYIQQMNEENKSTFEKIYDSALSRISDQERQQHRDMIKNRETLAQDRRRQQQEWQQEQQLPDFPVVSVTFPGAKKQTLVPAKEHIPYMFSDIEILPTGQINIEETVMVIANGQKLHNGLSRALPAYAYSRTGIIKPVDVNLNKVTVNDMEIPHKLEKNGLKIVIEPTDSYILNPGVYTYKFSYVINRNIWDYDDFYEFYWNVSGSSWNLVISRIGAIITLPGNREPLGTIALRGYPGSMQNDVAILQGHGNSVGFISTVPLFIGEGLHLIVSMNKNDFIAPDFNQKFSWFLDDYGDIIISFLALAAIIISYFVSWKLMQKTSGRQKYSLKRNAPLLRYLAFETFDKVSFGSFLLELFKKNIIDFAKDGDNLQLIKKTDNLSTLSRSDKKALRALFPGNEAVFEFNKANALKIKRAYNCVAKDTVKKFKMFTLKINSGYLLFSCGMLLLGEAGIALLQISPLQTFSILFGCSLAFFCLIPLFNLKLKNKYLNIAAKILSSVIICFNLVILWLDIHFISALFILGMTCAIYAYTKIFAHRSGLIRENIEDAKGYGAVLIKNAGNINLGRNFLTQQPNILASGVEKHFPDNPNIEKYYRLDIIQEILKKL